MSQLRLLSVAILFVGVVSSFAMAGTVSSPPTIELEKPVHFLTPNGKDVVVGPGSYKVQPLSLTIQPTFTSTNRSLYST